MRPSIVITIAVLLFAILGAAALQFFILAPDSGSTDEQGISATDTISIDTSTTGPSTFVHL